MLQIIRALTIASLGLAGCSSSGKGTPHGAPAGEAGSAAAGAASAGSSTAGGASGANGSGAGAPSGGQSTAGSSAGQGGSAVSTAPRIVVEAGALARAHSIVSFALAGVTGQSFMLEDEQAAMLPLQVGADGTATFVLPELAAGQERTFTVRSSEAAAPSSVTSLAGASDVSLAVAGTKLVSFQTEGTLPDGVAAVYLRGGYLHPLYSPAGVLVTDDYPASHVHHHGIWSAWTRAQFAGHAIDFWNMADGLGKVDFDSLGELWQGPVHAGFEADLAHIDLVGDSPVTALSEHWKVTAYRTHESAPPYLLFDLESVQRAATAMPVMLEEYIYGGFGIRGAGEWLDKSKVTFLTSEGFDRITGDAETGRWLYIGGTVGDKVAGYAVLGHPANFRAPQPHRIHPDEPYASLSPVKAGSFSIAPGADYVTRFRIVTLDGPPNAALLDALWNDYAAPATVRVE